MFRPGEVELTVVIVSYNSARFLPACLHSIGAARFDAPQEVIVVDNASTDESVRLVREQFPGVTVLANRENVGYSRAVNQAWRQSEGRMLLVLNPDIVVRPDAFQILHGYLAAHPEVGLVGPKLINPDGSLQFSCRRRYTLATYALRRTPLRRAFPDHPVVRRHLMSDWDHGEIRNVDWVLGAAMMMRREALGDTVMDERYFIYFEDVDLCLRLQREGWNVIYHPEAVMVHYHHRASAGGLLNRRKYEHFKSWVKFNWKHARR